MALLMKVLAVLTACAVFDEFRSWELYLNADGGISTVEVIEGWMERGRLDATVDSLLSTCSIMGMIRMHTRNTGEDL